MKLPFSPTRLRSVLGVLVVALALYALEHEFRDTHWDQLMAELRAVPLRALAAGLALTLASYALLVLFDRQGLALVDKRVAPARLAATSFVANALGHSLGLAPLTGGTVRLKGYGDAGVGLADVGRIAVHVSLAFLLGAWSLTGLTLARRRPIWRAVLPGDATFWRGLGIAILGVLAAGLIALGRQPRQLSIGRVSLRLPSRHVAGLALLISAAELCCAAGALYVMLPDGAPPFIEFAGSYVIAILAGVISTVPAGLGVFEWTLIQTLPQIDRNALLASIVAYRLVYYVVPLLLALAGMVVWSAGGTARRFSRLAASVIPAVAAAAVFTAGAWLLVAGVLPVPEQTVVSAPLPLLELSHLLGSLLGVFLLVLALGIQRCSHGAWLLTLGVLTAGVPIRTDPRRPAVADRRVRRAGRTAAGRPQPLLAPGGGARGTLQSDLVAQRRAGRARHRLADAVRVPQRAVSQPAVVAVRAQRRRTACAARAAGRGDRAVAGRAVAVAAAGAATRSAARPRAARRTQAAHRRRDAQPGQSGLSRRQGAADHR
ncbi:MAG: hypothetical protein NVV68_11515 [Dokdonella sp.]|nr:hypothetical protein [Dokdonella sp.]